jgi:hypothetical protein
VHTLPTLVGQRIVGVALGYEDVNDHDELRHDPVLVLFADRLEPQRSGCSPARARSTGWNTPRYARTTATTRSVTIRPALANLLVDLFLEAHPRPPKQITLDLDATDDPCTASRRGGSSTAITVATATYSCTWSAAGISSRPGCGPRTSMPQRARSRRWPGSSSGFAKFGRGCGPVARRLGLCP